MSTLLATPGCPTATGGTDWRHRAICRDEDPELFFPVGTSGPAVLQIAEAKTVCRRCPVVDECLAWASVMRILIKKLASDLAVRVAVMSLTVGRVVVGRGALAVAGAW